MPNIPDSQNIVTGDGRQKIPDTGEGYITEGIQALSEALGHFGDQQVQIEKDRATKSAVQQIKAKNAYIQNTEAAVGLLASDPDFANADAETITQKWHEEEALRRNSVIEGVNFYTEGSREELLAEFDAQNESGLKLLLNLHSKGVGADAEKTWLNNVYDQSVLIYNNPIPGTLFSAIYDLKAKSEKLVASLGASEMQAVLRESTFNLVKGTVLSLVERKQFEAAQSLLLGEWLEPATNKATSFDTILGDEAKRDLGDLIAAKWQESDTLEVQSLWQAVESGEAGEQEIAVALEQELIDEQQSQELRQRHAQVSFELQEAQKRADTVQYSMETGIGLDPYIPEHRQAVEERYVEILKGSGVSELPMEEQNQFTVDFIQKVGIVPNVVRQSLRKGRQGSVESQVRAADLFARSQNLPINVISDIPPVEAARLLVINQGIKAGKQADKAIEDAIAKTDPTISEQYEKRDYAFSRLYPSGGPYASEAANAALSLEAFIGASLNDNTPAGAVFVSDEAKERLAAELNSVFQQQYVLTGDGNLAQDYAENVVRRSWSATEVNGRLEFMKNAPDRFYGKGRERNLIRQELEADVEKLALPEGSQVSVVADEQTEAEARKTGKPSYKLVVTDQNGNEVEEVADRRLPDEPSSRRNVRWTPGEGVVEQDGEKSPQNTRNQYSSPYLASQGMVTDYYNEMGRRKTPGKSSGNKPFERLISIKNNNLLYADDRIRNAWGELTKNSVGDEYGDKGYVKFQQEVIKRIPEDVLTHHPDKHLIEYNVDKILMDLGENGVIPSKFRSEKYAQFFSEFAGKEEEVKEAAFALKYFITVPTVDDIRRYLPVLQELKKIPVEQLSFFADVLKKNDLGITDEGVVAFYKSIIRSRQKYEEKINKIDQKINDLDKLRDTDEVRFNPKHVLNKKVAELKRQKMGIQAYIVSRKFYDVLSKNNEVKDNIKKANSNSELARSGVTGQIKVSVHQGLMANRKKRLGFYLMTNQGNPDDIIREIELIDNHEIKGIGLENGLGRYVLPSINTFAEGIEPYAKSAVVGAVTGAAAVSLATAIGVAGPQALFPEEVATVPGTFMIAFSLGFKLNMANETYQLESGALYLELRDIALKSGVPFNEETARYLSMGIGLTTAALGLAVGQGSDVVNKRIERAMKDALKDRLFVKSMIQLGAKEIIGTAGAETRGFIGGYSKDVAKKGYVQSTSSSNDNIVLDESESDDYKIGKSIEKHLGKRVLADIFKM
ncbi:hypothetical protein [Kiloniella laminariae]|uniref:hypothetical protein n=1 Tax=Kiloniella laminariae TaxID=454162 RepID=UPI00036AB294|nr:hypothetical protein [Kiloniella laminariae]